MPTKYQWRFECKCGTLLSQGSGYPGSLIILPKCHKEKWYNFWKHSKYNLVYYKEVPNG